MSFKKLYLKHLQLVREAADGSDGPSLGSHGKATSGQFWGSRGAGIMPVCPSSGKVLLVLRSSQVNEPRTWGIPGGAIDSDESYENAARRELEEELGFFSHVEIKPAFMFEKGPFKFQNFFGIVDEEFEAILDWENEDYAWFGLNQLPSPLHFGTKALLANSKNDLLKILNLSHSVRIESGKLTTEAYQNWMFSTLFFS